jgi:pimeloyl-ACP methyl ester carboxylesterase
MLSLLSGSSPRCLRNAVRLPDVTIPEGYDLELPGRGTTYVTDVPGPPGAPTVLLLHAVGCTGMLTWFPAVEALSQRYRVVVFDQRWHGRGIQSDRFSLYDCADDVAAVIEELELGDVIVAGYSMGSVIAQRVWRQHPEKIRGLVLCATTDRFRNTPSETVFHQSMGLTMAALRSLSRYAVVRRTARQAARNAVRALDVEPTDIHDWALAEFRRTSPWAVGQAVAALGRHHSRPWLHRIDVPTAVVVTTKDHVLPTERQRALAQRIPATTIHEVAAGHAACVLQSDIFVPGLLEAVNTTVARARDRASTHAG